MNPLNPKRGDVVVPLPMFTGDSGLDVYEEWGGKSRGFPRKIGVMRSSDLGLVLESLEHQGGNGCRILFGGDTIGWVNFNLLRRVG